MIKTFCLVCTSYRVECCCFSSHQ